MAYHIIRLALAPSCCRLARGKSPPRAAAQVRSNSIPRTGLQPAGGLGEDDGSRWERVGREIGSGQPRGGWPNRIGSKRAATRQ